VLDRLNETEVKRVKPGKFNDSLFDLAEKWFFDKLFELQWQVVPIDMRNTLFGDVRRETNVDVCSVCVTADALEDYFILTMNH
jgi:hypothetical protein